MKNIRIAGYITSVLSVVTGVVGWMVKYYCFDGMLLMAGFGVLAIILLYLDNKNYRYMSYLLLLICIVFVVITPVAMVIRAGVEYIVVSVIWHYITMQIIFLSMVFISGGLTLAGSDSKGYAPLLKRLIAPLSIALIVRILFMIIMESRHIPEFSVSLPTLHVGTIILVSIPLFIAIWLLVVQRHVWGYVLGFVTGLINLVLVLVMVFGGHNPGWGPAIVILANIGIIVFSVRGYMRDLFMSNRSEGGLNRFELKVMTFILSLKSRLNLDVKALHGIGIGEGDRILDYGCGIGRLAPVLSKLVGDRGEVVCADIEARVLNVLKKRIKREGLLNVQCRLVENYVDIKEDGFDYILVINTIQMVNDKIGMIRHLESKLSEHGKLVVNFKHMEKSEADSVTGSVAPGRLIII